jgi:hypothetical protein
MAAMSARRSNYASPESIAEIVFEAAVDHGAAAIGPVSARRYMT